MKSHCLYFSVSFFICSTFCFWDLSTIITCRWYIFTAIPWVYHKLLNHSTAPGHLFGAPFSLPCTLSFFFSFFFSLCLLFNNNKDPKKHAHISSCTYGSFLGIYITFLQDTCSTLLCYTINVIILKNTIFKK